MNNNQLAERFAHGHTSGQGSNMFIEGETIYSYGYHFAIATRHDWGYAINKNGYSVTTAKHKRHVLSALRGVTLVYLIDCDIKKSQSTIDANNKTIEELKQKATNARKDEMRECHNRHIAQLEEQNRLIGSLIINNSEVTK
jgi:hypothetical protein